MVKTTFDRKTITISYKDLRNFLELDSDELFVDMNSRNGQLKILDEHTFIAVQVDVVTVKED